jgi:hypothetical protein
MKSFKELTENKKLFIDVWHGSRSQFEPPFKENLQGSENDEGFSGRGFYFFGQEKDVKYAVPNGYKRKFRIKLKKAYNLDKDDVFSKDTDLPFAQYRDEQTLELLKKGYDGAYRTLNGKLDEVCVFSYKKARFDGNKKIETIKGQDWQKI